MHCRRRAAPRRRAIGHAALRFVGAGCRFVAAAGEESRVLPFGRRTTRGIGMDLQRIRGSLAPQSGLDLDAAWRRYRGDGGLEDEDAFEGWLAAQYPHAFDANRTRIESPVETSRVLPARFALADDEAPTVLSARANAP